MRTQEKPLNSAWSRAVNWPCTGVSVGFSRVNSSSKLLVSARPVLERRINANPGRKCSKATHNLREIRRRYPLVKNIIKVDIFEERLSLDFFSIFFTGTKSSIGIALKELETNPLLLVLQEIEDFLTFCKIETASLGIVMGYRGSSSKIASKISSSSSPRNGDCPSNIS